MNENEPTNDIFKSVLATDGGNYVVDGPLSKKCAEVLGELYQIKTDKETGLAIETQMIDELGRSAWAAASIARTQLIQGGDAAGLMYGIDPNAVTMSNAVDLSDSLSSMTPGEKAQSVVYIDDADTATLNPFAQVIKRVADQQGVDVAVGLEEFKELLKKRARSGKKEEIN